MKLSIIVPVYNMANGGKIDFCLKSLLAQTIEDYEIIAVDDASTDDSLAVLRRYEAENPGRIKVLHHEVNTRQGGAKNTGLDVARGDYIGFVDSDDWIAPQTYQVMYDKALEGDYDIVSCEVSVVYEQTYEVGQVTMSQCHGLVGEVNEENFRRLLSGCGYMVTKLFKRDIFNPESGDKLRFPQGIFYEDNAIAGEAMHRARRVAYLEEPFYYYYQVPGSTTHFTSESRCEDRLEAMRVMMELARRGGYLETFSKELEFKFTNLFYRNTLFSYMQMPKGQHLAFLRKMGREMVATWPNYTSNQEYLATVPAEERMFMELNVKSPLLFFLYYKLKWGYRKLRQR